MTSVTCPVASSTEIVVPLPTPAVLIIQCTAGPSRRTWVTIKSAPLAPAGSAF